MIKNVFVNIAYNSCLVCHIKDYLEIIHTKSVLLPEENECVNFQNFKRLKNALLIIYGDFKCILIP